MFFFASCFFVDSSSKGAFPTDECFLVADRFKKREAFTPTDGTIERTRNFISFYFIPCRLIAFFAIDCTNWRFGCFFVCKHSSIANCIALHYY